MTDAAIQEEILSKDDVVKIVEAKEQGKRSQNLLGGGNINSLRQDYNSKCNNLRNDGSDNETKSFKKVSTVVYPKEENLEKERFSAI